MTHRLIARTALLLAGATAAPLAAHTQAAAAASQPAATRPNLAGMWELNMAASKLAPQGGPSKMTMTVVQAGDRITMTQAASTPMGDQTNTMHRLVGAATTDTLQFGGQSMPVTSTTRWDGTTLVVDGTLSVPGMQIPVVSRYALSADGKQLTVDQLVTTPMGAQSQRFVFDKKG